MSVNGEKLADADAQETREWLDSLAGVLVSEGPDRVRFLLNQLRGKAQRNGVDVTAPLTTPYINTIPLDRQPAFQGDRSWRSGSASAAAWRPRSPRSGRSTA